MEKAARYKLFCLLLIRRQPLAASHLQTLAPAPTSSAGAPTNCPSLMASQEATYKIAAIIKSERIPVHIDADSNIPPTTAPRRLDPSASPENLSLSKLLIKTIPAKKT